MAQPYVGEIRMFGGNFAPLGWHLCDGSPLPIAENEVLFQLIGTMYGGDGEVSFNLPNLGGRVPVGAGTSPASGSFYDEGQMSGVESVTLTVQQMPIHTHPARGSVDPGTSSSPQNTVPASMSVASGQLPYGTDPPPTTLLPASVAPIGGSQPHENTQPFLVVTFIIALFGLFPNPT